MKAISIIRQRGQLTIPDSIRQAINWVTPLSVVSISVINPDEIIIRPHQNQDKTDWDDLWKRIRRVRSFEGKARGNLSAFIAEDRQTRR